MAVSPSSTEAVTSSLNNLTLCEMPRPFRLESMPPFQALERILNASGLCDTWKAAFETHIRNHRTHPNSHTNNAIHKLMREVVAYLKEHSKFFELDKSLKDNKNMSICLRNKFCCVAIEDLHSLFKTDELSTDEWWYVKLEEIVTAAAATKPELGAAAAAKPVPPSPTESTTSSNATYGSQDTGYISQSPIPSGELDKEQGEDMGAPLHMSFNPDIRVYSLSEDPGLSSTKRKRAHDHYKEQVGEQIQVQHIQRQAHETLPIAEFNPSKRAKIPTSSHARDNITSVPKPHAHAEEQIPLPLNKKNSNLHCPVKDCGKSFAARNRFMYVGPLGSSFTHPVFHLISVYFYYGKKSR